MPARELDVTGEICPMSWVKAKLALESMAVGEVLALQTRGGQHREHIPRSARADGYEVLEVNDLGGDRYRILLRVQPR